MAETSVSIPDFVQIIVDQLSNDRYINSIWLIGSRANGTESLDSDWDILYFSENKPIPKKQRDSRVDTIHIGPSNKGLTEGKSTEFIFSFENWEWQEQHNGKTATYIGRKFIMYPDEVRNSTDPVYDLRKNNAYCLWRRT